MRSLTEDNRLGLLDSLAESAHRVVYESSVQQLRRVEEIHQEWGADWATNIINFRVHMLLRASTTPLTDTRR